MSKICKNVVNLPTNQNYNLIGVEPEKTKETEPKTDATATISTKLGKFQSFDELQHFINDYKKNNTKYWTDVRKYFSDKFTEKLRCIVYYQITNKDFDNFYWYCYNSAKQYLTGFTSYIDEEGIPLNPDKELKKWINDYMKQYPKLPPESQKLLEEMYNKQFKLYKRFNVSPSFN